MPLEFDRAFESQRGAFAVGRARDDAVECGESDEKWGERRAFDDFEVKLFFTGRSEKLDVHRNHGWTRAELAHDGGEAVLRESSDQTAGGHDFRGRHGRGESKNHVAAGERQRDGAQSEDWT